MSAAGATGGSSPEQPRPGSRQPAPTPGPGPGLDLGLDLGPVSSLVIVKPSSLGDVVHALPVARFLKRAHPDLAIRWVVNSEWAPLLAGNPDLAATVEFPRSRIRGWRAPWRMARFLHGIGRGPGADVVLDLQGLLRSAVISKRFHPRLLVGLEGAREGSTHFYDHVVPAGPDPHAVERLLAVPRAFGIACPRDQVEFPLPSEPPPQGLPAGYVALHPYARGAGKSMDASQIDTFCRDLAPRPVAVVGRTHQPPRLPPNGVDLSNKTTLPALVSVLRDAAFVVSVDSGPAHLAAAVNPRLLAIHTWTDPRRVGPYPPGPAVCKGDTIATRQGLPPQLCESTIPISSATVTAATRYVGERLDASGGD